VGTRGRGCQRRRYAIAACGVLVQHGLVGWKLRDFVRRSAHYDRRAEVAVAVVAMLSTSMARRARPSIHPAECVPHPELGVSCLLTRDSCASSSSSSSSVSL
jgi:hypothetical protein